MSERRIAGDETGWKGQAMPNRFIPGLIAAVTMIGTAVAGPLEEGYAAAGRGDDADAVRHWRPLARAGLAEAQFLIGVAYARGRGVPESNAEAVKWYRRAAAQGDSAAQFNLGVAYDEGLGVLLDDPEAIRWYRLAADQGDADAQLNLAFMYGSGEGVTPDDAESARWFERAAQQGGYPGAANKLGLMYGDGRGVEQDFVLSHMWFSVAVSGGHKGAPKNRDAVVGKMTAEQITAAQRLADEWRPKPEQLPE